MALNGTLKDLVKHVPSLVVYLATVYLFLNYLTDRDVHLDAISGECHKVQHESNIVMKQVYETLGENHVIARRTLAVLDALQYTRQHYGSTLGNE